MAAARAARGRAALVAGQRVEDLFAGHDLLDRQALVEERVRVVRGVLARLLADLARRSRFFAPYFQRYSRPAPPNICAVGGACAKPCTSSIACACLATGLSRSSYFDPRAPFSIFSKPRTSDALGDAALDRLLGEHEGRRAGRAVVVHVEDGDARQPDLVGRALAARAVAVDVAGVHLLHRLVRDLRVARGRCAPPSTPSRGSPRSVRAWRTSSSRHRLRSLVEPSHHRLQIRSLRNPSLWAMRTSPSTRSLPCW